MVPQRGAVLAVVLVLAHGFGLRSSSKRHAPTPSPAAVGLPESHEWTHSAPQLGKTFVPETFARAGRGFSHMDHAFTEKGCSDFHHLDLARSACKHSIRHGPAACKRCLQRDKAFAKCSPPEIKALCDRDTDPDYVKKHAQRIKGIDYTQSEFRPKQGFTTVFGEIGACLLSRTEEVYVLLRDMARCTAYDVHSAAHKGMRCGAYAASDLARNVRRCCLGFEHVVMGTEAEAQCKSGVLDILPSIYGYVQPAYKQCVSGPHLCHGSWWGKKALSCREQGWDSHEMCLRVVADFMHTASLLIRRATTFYQLGEPADITKKAKNAITLCDHRTLTMFNRADEMLPQLPFVARNTPIPQPGVDVDQADGKVARAARKKGTARKREDMISPATEIERGLVWPQWHAQSVCVARLFRFIEKHGTAFGDPHDM